MDPRTKKVSLDFMGDGWADCFVEMRFITWADYKRFTEIEDDHREEFVDAIISKLRHVFVSGQVLVAGKPQPLTAEMIAEFDIETLKVLNNAALGYTDPKE